MDAAANAWRVVDARTRAVVLVGLAVLLVALAWRMASAPADVAPVIPRTVTVPGATAAAGVPSQQVPAAGPAGQPATGAVPQRGQAPATAAAVPGASVTTSSGTVVSLAPTPRVPAPAAPAAAPAP